MRGKNVIENLSVEEIYSLLDEKKRDDLYRLLWVDYVREDVISFLEIEGKPTEEQEEVIDRVVNAYVYNGDYDCCISYWENIRGLVDSLAGGCLV